MNTVGLSYAESVQQNHNKEEMLYRSLGTIVQLYTDKSHFIYELLQNAEDAGATEIRFIQYDDRLEVLHNGHSFTYENFDALCDVGKSDKKADLNQIGEFGIGFKSVYGICKEVLLYSHPTDDEISHGIIRFASKITDFTNPIDIEDQDFSNEYTTKFVFPYAVKKCDGVNEFLSFTTKSDLKSTISDRLQNLGVTTLLFLKNLKSIDYEIDTEEVKSWDYYSLEKISNDHYSFVKGNRLNTDKTDEETSYLVFSKSIDDTNLQRTVDIAFPVTKTDEGKYIFKKAKDSNISVYFPTGTESKLNFIVQGPFRTAPDRTKVPDDNIENINLANIAADLLCESIRELAMRNELDYSLIEILPLDESAFENYALFKVMYEKMRQLFSFEELIPYDGGYTNAKSALIARGKDLSTVFTDELITELWNDGREYHWLPAVLTETNKEYTKTYNFLTQNGIKVLTPGGLRKKFNDYPNFFKKQSNDWLVQLYNMFANSRSEFSSWNQSSMSYARFIKTTDGEFVSAYKDNDQPNVFLPCKNESLQKGMNVVDRFIYERCKYFFHSILELREPNECELFISDFKKRYEKYSKIEDAQYKKDVKDLLGYYYNFGYTEELDNLFFNYLPIRCFQSQGESYYIRINKDDNAYKGRLFFPVSVEGLDIEVYYRGVCDNNVYVDFDFYSDNSLTSYEMDKLKEKLKSMGFTDDISVGKFERKGKIIRHGSKVKWTSDNNFAWLLNLDKLEEVINWIQNTNYDSDSIRTNKEKSSTIFKFLRIHERKLSGTVYINNDPCNSKSKIVKQLSYSSRENRGTSYIQKPIRWLYTKDGRFVAPCEITKYELDETLYGEVDEDSPLYDLLGFKKDIRREKDEAIKKKYSVLSEDEKSKYLEMALEERGISSYEFDEFIRQRSNQNTQSNQNYLYVENDDFDFPSYKVRNWESLRKHVAEVVYTADSVKYEYVMRHIRTSKPESQRAYLKSMYKIDYSEKCACQMCHKPTDNVEACQIEKKPTIELDPMHLCLCRNCASKFKQIRNDESENFLKRIRRLSDSEMESPECVKVYLTHDEEIWFNQTHAAEIREILTIQEDDDINHSESKQETPTYDSLPAVVETQIEDKTTEIKEKTPAKTPSFVGKFPRKAEDFKSFKGHRVYHTGLKKYAILSEFYESEKKLDLDFEEPLKIKNGENKLSAVSADYCIENNLIQFVD